MRKDDEKTAAVLSQVWLQSDSAEELELRLAAAGTTLEEARDAWSRENKDLLEIVYKNFLDERREKIDLKKLMKSKSKAAKVLPSRSKIEIEGKQYRFKMWTTDSGGKEHVMCSSYFDDDADLAAFPGGREAFEAEIAWTLLFELEQTVGIPF